MSVRGLMRGDRRLPAVNAACTPIAAPDPARHRADSLPHRHRRLGYAQLASVRGRRRLDRRDGTRVVPTIPARELRICTAPTRGLSLDAKEVEVATRRIRPDLSDVAALESPQSVLRNSQRHRDLAAPSRDRVFAAIEYLLAGCLGRVSQLRDTRGVSDQPTFLVLLD